jgi:CheY-like chemotaxis protein
MIAAAAPLQGLRLLVVEDETMVAMMLEMMLDTFGCIVTNIAGTLPRALAFAQDESIALDGAILDVNLGGEKVYPVADCLAARGVPFVFCTGYGPAGLESKFAKAPTLAKPYQPDDLEALLVSAMINPDRRSYA